MEQPERLAKRILDCYDAMPRGERRLADLLLEQPMAVVEKSAAQLAERAAVSKATTTRFFRRLGYQSFKAAQKAAREQGVDPQPVEFGARMHRLAHQQMDLSQHLQSECAEHGAQHRAAALGRHEPRGAHAGARG